MALGSLVCLSKPPPPSPRVLGENKGGVERRREAGNPVHLETHYDNIQPKWNKVGRTEENKAKSSRRRESEEERCRIVVAERHNVDSLACVRVPVAQSCCEVYDEMIVWERSHVFLGLFCLQAEAMGIRV